MMRGLAPPEWLNQIGSSFRVDPEYFRQHLRFLQPYGWFDIPGLPCNSGNYVRLPLVTNGHRKVGDPQPGADMAQERRDVGMRIDRHLRQLDRTGHGGQSIVRKLMLHNEAYYSLEQEVSLCVLPKSGGWIALVWLDCGIDRLDVQLNQWLKLSGSSPLTRFNLLPVFQFREKTAMKGESRSGARRHTREPSFTYEQHVPNVASAQSATLLPQTYGLTLDPAIIRTDAFYALSEIFAFSAFSENQFLNLLASVIEKEQNLPLHKMQASLANLQAFRDILEDHIKMQQALITFIETRARLKWPRANEAGSVAVVEAVANGLLDDFNHVLMHATRLRQQCIDMTTLTINQAMLEEAQRGLSQGAALSRLTLLAFLFVPLSFTTSFFGMSFTQLQNAEGPKLSIYVWFVVSAPLFVGSLAFLFWEQIFNPLKARIAAFI